MVNFKKIMPKKGRRGPLGGAVPPSIEEAPNFTSKPETFEEGEGAAELTPRKSITTEQPPAAMSLRPSPATRVPMPAEAAANLMPGSTVQHRGDETIGRSGGTGGKGHKTGRVHQLGSRFTLEFIERVERHCQLTGLKRNAFLEKCLDAYEELALIHS